MEKGSFKHFGHAYQLLQDPDSILSILLKTLNRNEEDSLRTIAKIDFTKKSREILFI